MRYAQIRSMDISNGEGIGVALFVQGCHFHCYNCFNQETWDFNGGKEWTEDIKNQFLKLIDKPYIRRISFLGGDPLAEENLQTVSSLIKEIKDIYPDKSIWIYTGYRIEEILTKNELLQTIKNCDVLIDGRYIDTLQNLSLKWRGSRNQRVIDVQQTLKSNEVILYGNDSIK